MNCRFSLKNSLLITIKRRMLNNLIPTLIKSHLLITLWKNQKKGEVIIQQEAILHRVRVILLEDNALKIFCLEETLLTITSILSIISCKSIIVKNKTSPREQQVVECLEVLIINHRSLKKYMKLLHNNRLQEINSMIRLLWWWLIS